MKPKYVLSRILKEIFHDFSIKRTRRIISLFSLIVALSCFHTGFAQNALVPFTFTLNKAATTSAGVFKKDSTLVRTLWNNVKYNAGTQTAYWDRKDDGGHLVTDTSYVIRVVSGNFTYNWEGGIIGNTSDSLTGPSKHRYFERPNGMAIAGNTAYFSTGYSEGISAAYKFSLSAPQSRKSILSTLGQIDLNTTFTATDGTNVYWAGFDAYNDKTSMVYGTTTSGDKEVMFSSGTSVAMTYGRTYARALDVYTSGTDGHPTGMAVQKNGKYLFVSHGAINELHVLNKTTGALVQTISVTNPRELCVDMNDNLWMISATNTVEKYTVNTNGTLTSPTLSITGLSEPVAISVSPNNYMVVIADAGTSQQVKAFNNQSGGSVWTLGKAGGYANDATVQNDKFYFRDLNTLVWTGVFIAFQPDSSFWVADPGNERVQHFSASRTFINNIASMPCTYSVEVDRNDPTRVFSNFLEFKIDYSKPLAANNGSWVLVKNWRRGTPSNYFGAYGVLRNVITLSNGRTYAAMEDPSATKLEFVELPSTGNMRFTGIKIESWEDFVLEKNGDLRIWYTGSVGDSIQWINRHLNGFDSKGNPQWASPVTIASSPKTTIEDPKPNGMVMPVMTSSNRLITFCPRKNDGYGLRSGFHLGAIKKGTNKWLWKASASTFDSYAGPMPTDGAFDIGNGVEYPGGQVYTIEKNIFWNYHGEFWKLSQTNIWNHYADNGLMLGQFGITTPDGENAYGREAFPMGAGNVFSSTIVKVDSFYYLYHNDESVHGAVHRWKIGGLNSMREQSINISLTTTKGGLMAGYYNGRDLNNFNFSSAQVTPQVNMGSAPANLTDSTKYSVRWSGFVKPSYSQDYTFYAKTSKGVRLWVNGQLIVDKWSNSTTTEYSSAKVTLDKNYIYTIKMETSGGTATLSWSSSSQGKQLIPSTALYPASMPDYSKSYDLLEGFTPRTIVQNGLYGWNRNSTSEDNTSSQQYWNVTTGVQFSKDENHTDLSLKYRQDNNDYYVTRDLGTTGACLTSWKVSGLLNLSDNFSNWDDDHIGIEIQVLDENNKVIATVTHEKTFDQANIYNSYLKINGTPIYTMTDVYQKSVLSHHQPFSIDVTNGNVTFTFAGFSKTVKPFDTTGKWNKPKTFRVYFHANTNGQYHHSVDFPALAFTPVGNVVTATASGPTTFCQGGSVTLTASAGNSYKWSNNATTRSINVNSSGTYNVTVTGASGCQATSSNIAVTVNPLPTATVTPSGSTTFCQGDSVTLTSSNANAYKWNNNKTTKAISVKTSGQYSVSVTDANGCSQTSSPVTVTVSTTPTATISADGPTSFCTGGSVNLTCNETGSSYKWSSGQTTKSINVTTAGNYSVTLSNGGGCSAVSNVIAVQVGSQLTVTVTPSGPTTFCQGGSVTLTAPQGSSYKWNNNETTQSINVNASGNYSVQVTDSKGCSGTSGSTNVTVNPLPQATISANGPTTFCQGQSVVLTASPSGTFQWSNTKTTQSITVTTSGNYTVKVTDQNKCTGISAATTVTVTPVVKPKVSRHSKNVLISSAVQGNQWYKDGTMLSGETSQFLNVSTNGNYTVEVDSLGLGCKSTSDALTVGDVSVDEVIGAGNVKVYPNPTSGIFNIEIPSEGRVEINVVNMMGAVVFTGEFEGKTTVDLSGYASGVYTVILVAGESKLSRKVTIQ